MGVDSSYIGTVDLLALEKKNRGDTTSDIKI
jgi:hypothetical protein